MINQPMHEKIKEVAGFIGKKFQPEKIILFGSHAWSRPGPDSDVDLLIVKETADTRATARMIDGAIFPRPFPLDIIVYRPAQLQEAQKKDFFIRHIMRKGRLLYGQR